MNESSTANIRCEICGTTLGSTDELRLHERERHGDAGGTARGSDDAGGTIGERERADGGAGRVQTE